MYEYTLLLIALYILSFWGIVFIHLFNRFSKGKKPTLWSVKVLIMTAIELFLCYTLTYQLIRANYISSEWVYMVHTEIAAKVVSYFLAVYINLGIPYRIAKSTIKRIVRGELPQLAHFFGER